MLRVADGARAEEIRTAYRRLIAAHHPDRNIGAADTTATAAAINEAFRVLRSDRTAVERTTTASPSTPGTAPAHDPSGPFVVLRPDGDSIALAAPADDVFLWLHDAVADVADLTHVDPDAGLLEAKFSEPSGNLTSVVVSLQGRGDGTTEAFCSAERLTGAAAVDLPAIVDRIVDRLAAH